MLAVALEYLRDYPVRLRHFYPRALVRTSPLDFHLHFCKLFPFLANDLPAVEKEDVTLHVIHEVFSLSLFSVLESELHRREPLCTVLHREAGPQSRLLNVALNVVHRCTACIFPQKRSSEILLRIAALADRHAGHTFLFNFLNRSSLSRRRLFFTLEIAEQTDRAPQRREQSEVHEFTAKAPLTSRAVHDKLVWVAVALLAL